MANADILSALSSLRCDLGRVKKALQGVIDGGAGQPGKEIQLQSTSTELQWRYVGDATWQTLATFAQLTANIDYSNFVNKTADQTGIAGTKTWTGPQIYTNTQNLAAGTATVAPLKFTSGVALTTPVAGVVDFVADKVYITISTGPARKEFTLNDIALSSSRVPFVTTNGRLQDLSTFLFLGTNGGRLAVGTTSTTSSFNLGSTVATSGNNPLATFTGAAHTGQTAGTELFDVNFNLNRTVQFATGALASQRAIVMQAPTYSFVGASTITNAATLYVSGPPIAGTNATITNPYSLWINTGNSLFNGNVNTNGQFNGSGAGLTSIPSTGITNTSFVDLTTAQNVGGAKTWTGVGTFSGGLLPDIDNSRSNGTGANRWLNTQSVNVYTTSIRSPNSNGLTFLNSSSVGSMRIFDATNNTVLYNNATAPSDNLAGLQLNHSITASSGLARGMTVTPTLTAAANGDQLVALDINQTNIAGAFTGLSGIAIRTNGDIQPLNSGVGSVGGAVKPFANFYGTTSWSNIYRAFTTAGLYLSNNSGTAGLQVNNSARVLIQPGGTFTDSGEQLQVTGDQKLTGNLNISGQVNSVQTATSAIANFTPGTLKTTPNVGDLQATGDRLIYAVTGAATKDISLQDNVFSQYHIPIAASTGRLGSTNNFTFANSRGGVLWVGPQGAANFGVQPLATSGGNWPLSVFTAAAHTNQTASTEVIDNYWNSSATLQFATGAIGIQRTNSFSPRTYSFVGASTITTAATVSIDGAPIAGTNATITNPYAFWVRSGIARFESTILGGGGLGIAGNATVGGTLGVTGVATFSNNVAIGGNVSATAALFQNVNTTSNISVGTTIDAGGKISTTSDFESTKTAGGLIVKDVTTGVRKLIRVDNNIISISNAP